MAHSTRSLGEQALATKALKACFHQMLWHSFLETMTPELVKECFRKTGVMPFDCKVVTAQQMAPSKQHSMKFDVKNLSSPVKCIVAFQSCLIMPGVAVATDGDAMMDLHPSQDPCSFSAHTTSTGDSSDDGSFAELKLIHGKLSGPVGHIDVEGGPDIFMDSLDPTLCQSGSSPVDSNSMDIDSVPVVVSHVNDNDSGDVPQASLSTQSTQHGTSLHMSFCTPPHLLHGMFSGSSAKFLVNGMLIKSSFHAPSPVYGTIPTLLALTTKAVNESESSRVICENHSCKSSPSLIFLFSHGSESKSRNQ